MKANALRQVVEHVRDGSAHADAIALLTAALDEAEPLWLAALEPLDGQSREQLLGLSCALASLAGAAIRCLGDVTGIEPEIVLNRWGLLRPV